MSLQLVREGETLWEYDYTPGSPRDVMSKTKSTQEMVRLKEVPDFVILDRIEMLPYMTAPKYKDGFGRSELGLGGMTDEPLAAGP